MSQVIQNIAKAKAGLILDQPFFATLLLGMSMIEDKTVTTMGTDGDNIYFNPDWVANLTVSEITFVLAHEVMHVVFQHMLRRGERNANKWNIAADYIINDLLVNEKVGSMPHGGLLNPQLVQQGDGTAEGVYKLLPKETENKKPGDDGGSMDELIEPGGGQPGGDGGKPGGQPGGQSGKSPGTKPDGQSGTEPGQMPGGGSNGHGPVMDEAMRAEKSAEIKVRVASARQAAKMSGKLSQGIDDLVKDLIKSETDWKTILRQFFSERAKTELSYARPKRRFLAQDLYLPSLNGEQLGPIAIAVDCSGSIGRDELKEFEQEINGIIDDTMPTEVRVLYFHTDVYKTVVYKQGEHVKLESTETGGTAFSPIFETINADNGEPVRACVVLTDLCADDFGPMPEYPVLWASTRLTEAPFGDVIKLQFKGGA
jgi:predicted metal-dependent peptidase